jgi:thiamine biosynthesis lipoprotein
MSKEGDKSSMTSRRAFLKTTGAFFTAVALLHGKPGFRLPIQEYEESRIVMGSSFRLTGLHANRSILRKTVSLAFDEMKRLESLMTIYSGDSEISRLNEHGFSRLNSDTVSVLKKALYYSNLTGGAFDVTLGNYQYLLVDKDSAIVLKDDMSVDLGAIGIGFAVDRAAEILRKNGVQKAIIDGGGEIRTMGKKENGLSWRVGIRNPFNKKQFICVIELENLSVSTSGNYEKNHVLDPRTKKSPKDLNSVTVIAKNTVDADALSTAAFVLGETGGMDLIEKILGVEGLMITSKGEILSSSGLDRYMV